MYNILSSVLSNIFRLFWNTARSQLGYLTEEKCREILVQDLDTIKTKLDGLARKDLLSSFSFLKEGICRLKKSFEDITTEQNCDATALTRDEKATVQSSKGNLTKMPSTTEDVVSSLKVVFNEARSLTTMLKTSKVIYKERYLAAKESFKETRKEATRAFSNGALDTEDRILATKLRIIGAILENLEDPDAGMSDCIIYLEALHSLPAIEAAFSGYCNCLKCRGTREKDAEKRTQILENIRSVGRIHEVMYDFAKAFTRNPPEFLLKWPTVNVATKSIHPVYEKNDTLAICYEIPFDYKATRLNTFCSAVNSKGEIIAMSWNDDEIKLIKPTGEIKVFCSLPLDVTLPTNSLAVDDQDNVYILTRYKEQNENDTYEILVLDAEGNNKQQHPLDFPTRKKNVSFTICVNDSKKVFIHCRGDDKLYVYDTTGATEVTMFPLEQSFDTPLCLNPMKADIIILAPQFKNVVYLYTEKGCLLKKIKTTHEVHGLAFRCITRKIVIYACVYPKCSYKLLSYTQSGILRQTSRNLPDKWDEFGRIMSHPKGPLVLLHNNGILHI